MSLCPALIVLGRLQARRGEGDAGGTLADAWRRAVATGELQRLGPAAAARAEHAWLEGDLEAVAEVARPAYELAAGRGDAWSRAELAHWLWRAGEPVPPAPDDPEPYARALAGDWEGAAAAWERLGFAYDAPRRSATPPTRTPGSRRSPASRRSARCARPRTCGGGCAPPA